jgi:hypothetical protein
MLTWFEKFAPIRTRFKVLIALQAFCTAPDEG